MKSKLDQLVAFHDRDQSGPGLGDTWLCNGTHETTLITEVGVLLVDNLFTQQELRNWHEIFELQAGGLPLRCSIVTSGFLVSPNQLQVSHIMTAP